MMNFRFGLCKALAILCVFILCNFMSLDAVLAGDNFSEPEMNMTSSIHGSSERDALRLVIDQYSPLEYGVSGTDVFKMNERLCELGYLCAMNLSNIYDDAVADSLRSFQKVNGLSPTGRADSLSLALLFSDLALPAAEHGSISPNDSLEQAEQIYILNLNTKKFHYESCSSVEQMKEKNKKVFTGFRDDVVKMGYDPCGRCNP